MTVGNLQTPIVAIKACFGFEKTVWRMESEPGICHRCGETRDFERYRFGTNIGTDIKWFPGKFCGFACFMDEHGWSEDPSGVAMSMEDK